jgi:hypothetical protein
MDDQFGGLEENLRTGTIENFVESYVFVYFI